MSEIKCDLKGKICPPVRSGGMRGALLFIELDEPYRGRKYGVMNDNTQGRPALRRRLGRVQKAGDEVIITRFELGSEALRVLEVV